MTPAAATELFKLKPVGRVLFVLGRNVITFFALSALQNNIISRHTSSKTRSLPVMPLAGITKSEL